MNSEKKHIVDKVFLEVVTSSEKEAYRIKNSAGQYAQEKMLPILEELFENYNTGENILRFDRLNIDFSIPDWEDENQLKVELREHTREQLNRLLNVELQDEKTVEKWNSEKGIEHIINPQQNKQATFLYFIENGYLPWFGKQEYIEEIISPENWNENLAEESFISELKKVLRDNTNAVERIVLQFSDELILDLIVAFNVLIIKGKKQLLKFITSTETDFRNSFLKWLVMLTVQRLDKTEFVRKMVKAKVAEMKNAEQNVHVIVEEIKKLTAKINRYITEQSVSEFFPESANDIRTISEELLKIDTDVMSGKGSNESANSLLDTKPTIQNDEFVSDENESSIYNNDNLDILIKNAGLVILGPFLPAFFKQFGWITRSGEIKMEERFKVIQALHFLASGETDFIEGNMLFEKFLCGVSFAIPIPKKNILSSEVLEEAENMLRQVIKHWPALKKTGPNGLRQLFIDRVGKLIETEPGYKLIVERKAQDVLLDKLQWNISLLKLPWKEELLFVEW